MLGLPSTTEVGRRIPKEAFYKNMRLDIATKRDFVEGVESIVVANSVKPSTANVADGRNVHEVLVVAVAPKGGAVPERVVRTIFDASGAQIVLVATDSGSVCVRDRGRDLWAEPLERLDIAGVDMDAVWDSMLAQVVLREKDGRDVRVRIDRLLKIESLRTEAEKLDARARRERQVSRKNEAYALLRRVRAELEELEEE